MVIWRGWGFVVLLFILLAMAIGMYAFPTVFTAVTGYEYTVSGEQGIGWGVGWLIVGILLFLFNRFVLLRLERVPASGEQMQARIEAKEAAEARGETVVAAPATKAYSTFFFIPLRWIPIGFVALGILVIGLNVAPAIEQRALTLSIDEELREFEEELADLENE